MKLQDTSAGQALEVKMLKERERFVRDLNFLREEMEMAHAVRDTGLQDTQEAYERFIEVKRTRRLCNKQCKI